MILTSLLAPALAGLLSAEVSDANRNESLVQTLHRKGVHCMDVLERPACAIEKFEAVLDEQTMERGLVTDSLLRLVKLQRKNGDDDAVRDLLRRFWDIGMKRRQGGHVPFSMRFVPPELDMLFTIDIERVLAAPVLSAAGDDMAEFIFTCDPEVRNNIKMTRRWDRAQQQALMEGREAYEIIYEDMDERRKRRETWEKQRAQGDSKSSPSSRRPGGGKEPIFAETCKVAEALGHGDLRKWSKIGGAMNHKDFARSIAVIEVPDLDAHLAEAKRVGSIVRYGPDHYVLKGGRFAKKAIHLAKLDRNELVVAREDMIGPVIAARDKRKRQMNRDLDKLVGEVPKDSAFFLVLSKEALEGLSLGHMKTSTQKFLQALLPKPKGLQVAVVFSDYVGMFTRVPTDNPVKGKMLISIAQMMVDGRAEKDPQAEAWLKNLDLAQASDKRALLMTYVMTKKQVEDIVWD
jgi:hypothetical protein